MAFSAVKSYPLIELSEKEIDEHIVSCLNKKGLKKQTKIFIKETLPGIIQKYGLAGTQTNTGN